MSSVNLALNVWCESQVLLSNLTESCMELVSAAPICAIQKLGKRDKLFIMVLTLWSLGATECTILV